MATLIGVVRMIVGEVQVLAADGSRRLLVEGDRVFAGEQVLTGAGGAVAISLANGGELTLGRDSSLLLDEQMLAGASEGMEAAPPPTAQALTDIEQLQQVIAAGGDPTAELPPTAAGPGAGAAGGDGGGGISFVLLNETAGRVDPEIGYPTGPLAFDPLSPEELPAAPGLAETLDALPEDPTVVPEDPVVTPEDPVITPDDPVTTPEDPVITPEDPVVPPGDPVVPPVDSSPVVTVEHFTDASGTVLAERGFVSEGGLPGGSGAGERPVVSFGRLAIDAPDGVQAIEVQDAAGNWVDVTAGGVVQGVYGTLVVTADGSWSYSLGGAQVHGDPAATLGDLLLDSFQVRVVDGDGDLSAPAALLIEVADDGPQAFDDSVTTPEDTTVTVNVLANDTRGADSPAQLVAASLVAGSGSVSFDAAGNVTFTPTAGFEGTATIRYTLRDADGDSSEATLSVQVGADSAPTVEISYGPGNGVVDEAALDGGELGGGQAGSNPGSAAEQTSGTLTVQTGADSVGTVLIGSVLIDGVDVTAGGTVNGQYGTLQVTRSGEGQYSWTYTLSDNTLDHSGAGQTGSADQVLDVFSVQATDSEGDAAPAQSLTIRINDDGPQAFDDSVTTPEDSAVTVNVLANDTRGADSPAQLVAASLVAGSGSVSFDAAGNVTFTPSAGFEGTANIRYTLRDADGDASEATLSVQVGADSKPTVAISYGPGNGVVDEAALDGGELGGGQAGSNPGSATEQTSGTLTIQTGADSVGTVLIGSVLIDGVDVTAGGTVNGQYGTLQVTRSGEGQYSWTYTLSDNTLDHSGAGQTGSADQVLDVFSVQATDSEGDAAPAQSLTIRINDDGPQAFQPESVVILDQGAGTRVVSGDLHFAGQAGADGVGTVHFSIVEGSAALDSAGNQIRLDGEPLYLYYGSDETQLLARTAPDGITGFSIELDPAGDSYTLTTYGPLSVGAQEVSVTSLTSVGGGNAGYKALLDVGGTAQDVLLSSTTGTVNTDSDDIGVGQAQTLQAGENLRLDFVNSLAVADTSIGFTYDDHNRISEFRQKVFINGAKSATASLTVSAILADDDLVFGSSDPQESRVALDADDFRVWNGTQDVTAQVSITPNADGSVSLAGIKDGWVFSFSADTRFSALQIEADSGTSRFSLGFFTYSEIGDAAPIHMNQAITGYDSDGDSVSGSLSASLYPQGTAPLGAAGDVQEEAGIASDEVLADAGSDEPGDLPGDDLLAGGDAGGLPGAEEEGGQPAAGEDAGIDGAGDALPGSLAALVLEGGDGADLLLGAAGDDVLRGGDGNDVLAGGAGDDLLTGGAGADSFVWRAGESGTDRITDFTPGEDSLDLSELLVGAEGLDAAQSSSELASSLTGYLNVAFGSSTTITVDGDLGASQTIVLEGVDLSSVYASSDEATVIQNMLDDGSLKVV